MTTAIFRFVTEHLSKSITRYQRAVDSETAFGPAGLSLDSVELLLLFIEVENAFHVEIQPEEYPAICTIGDLCSLVVRKKAPWNFCLACRGQAERDAIIDATGSLSYGSLLKAIRLTAEQLWDRGVRPGDRVVLLMESGAAYIISYFAIQETGAIPVLADPKDAAVSHIAAEETLADYILSDAERPVENYRPLQAIRAGETLPPVNVFERGEKAGSVSERLSQAVLIHYTSGSTGRPCGVVQSGRSYLEMVTQYAACMGFGEADRFLLCLPPFHGYGLSCVLLPALYRGSLLVLMKSFLPREALALMKAHRISHLYGVPATFELLLRASRADASPFETIEYCCSSSLFLDPRLIASFHQHTGLVIEQEYGSGETGVISFSADTEVHEGEYSVGRPMPGVSCRLDGQGQLLVKSPGIALGYVSGELFPAWYPTGDRAELIDGQLYLRGRIKKLLDVGGQKVAAEEVDRVLQSCPGVRQAVSFQMREPGGVGYIGAFVRAEGEAFSERDVLLFCARQLEAYKLPRRVIPVDEIPLSASGKITSDAVEMLKQKYL